MKEIIESLIFHVNYRTNYKYSLELTENIIDDNGIKKLIVSLVCSDKSIELASFKSVINNLTEEDLVYTYDNIYNEILISIINDNIENKLNLVYVNNKKEEV